MQASSAQDLGEMGEEGRANVMHTSMVVSWLEGENDSWLNGPPWGPSTSSDVADTQSVSVGINLNTFDKQKLKPGKKRNKVKCSLQYGLGMSN